MDKRTLISPDTQIKQALKVMDKTAHKTLFVVKNEKLIGSVSDGDIRRAILQEINLTDPISSITNTSPTMLTENYKPEEVKRIFLEKRFEAIPIVDENSSLKNIIYWNSFFQENKKEYKKLNNPVIIMAGGRGTRLEPFTNILPKPLIPVGEKTMIETIIDEYVKYNLNEFYITVNHKAKIIKAYFEETNVDYNIHYIDEDKPLGTAGSIKYLQGKFTEPLFISNCDIIIDEDYNNILTFHEKGKFDITLIASMQHFQIPYGICDLNKDGSLKKIDEKPEYDFLVNTGMYILNPDLISLIPNDTFYHITHLISDVQKLGKKIGVYPVSEKSWIDIGQWSEYKKNLHKLK